MGVGDVDGIVEMDETFVTESFKCNHKKSGFKMPRPARERGKQVKKRGISNEQICIATVIDRGGNLNVLGQILLQRLHFCTHCTCSVFKSATFKEVFQSYSYSLLELLYGNIEVKEYGDKIRRERLLLGITQKEYSKYLKIPYKTLLKLEYGIINK